MWPKGHLLPAIPAAWPPKGVQRGFAQPSELRRVAAYELALRVKLRFGLTGLKMRK